MRALLLSLAAAVLLLAGCNGQVTDREGADLGRGQQIFTEKCGACHTMKAAGTQGQIGPNLDDAFGYARGDNFDSTTFFEVALKQLQIAAPPMPDYDDRDGPDYLDEESRVSVAAYVANCAGGGAGGGDAAAGCTSGAPAAATGGTPEEQGKSLFTSQGCGSCHTLEDAGTSGTVGPNLDDAKPSKSKIISQVTNGGGAMPAFGDRLSQEQIEALAAYLTKATG